MGWSAWRAPSCFTWLALACPGVFATAVTSFRKPSWLRCPPLGHPIGPRVKPLSTVRTLSSLRAETGPRTALGTQELKSGAPPFPVPDHPITYHHQPPWMWDPENLLPEATLAPIRERSRRPSDSPFLTGKVDSQQDTLLRVLAPAAVHHHHVAGPLSPGALQAHSLDRQRCSYWPALPDGHPFPSPIQDQRLLFLPFPREFRNLDENSYVSFISPA